MIHQFYRYEVDLGLYQYQEIPQTIIPYEKRFERSLSTAIKQFQKELHWDDMWDLKTAEARLSSGFLFWIYKPKNQIKGWTWLTPEGEIKNVYVSKWSRSQGIGKSLVFQCMNVAIDLDYSSVWANVDIWNEASKAMFDRVLEIAGCKSNITVTEKEYER